MGSGRIGIMGAGSIGCYIGGRLVALGSDVVFIGRPRLGSEVHAHGLHTSGVSEVDTHSSVVRWSEHPRELVGCDAVLVCVKSASTAQVGEALADVLSPEVPVVSLQNGVSNVESLSVHLPLVVPGVVEFNVLSMGEGRFHRGMDGPITIQRHEALESLFFALRATGLPLRTPEDIGPDQWAKLLMNLNNAVSALSGAPTRDLVRVAGYRHIVASIIEEGLAVLDAAGQQTASLQGVPAAWMPRILRLPSPLVRLVAAARMRVDPRARSSMWEDLQKRRITEVPYLNGEIVALAQKVGVPAPLNARIVQLVHEAESAGAGSPGYSAEELWARLTAP